MTNNFTSNENKSLIWNLIYEQGGFNDIPESRIDNIKLLLNNKVLEINNDDLNKNKSNIELNKILLKSFNDDLKIYKLNENKTIFAKKEENINEFNEKLENYRNDMNNILNVKQPKTPTFEDNITNDLNDVSVSYDKLLKMREQQENQIEIVNTINNKNDNNKTSFLDFSTELFKIDENLSSSPEENNSHITLSNLKKISPNLKKLNENIPLVRRNSIDSNESNESVLSINIDSIEFLDSNENNTVLYINRKLDQIKNFDKILNGKKYSDERSDNNFNIHNKLNIIINKLDDLFNKYDDLCKKYDNIELQLESFKNTST
tara:strand:+ start:1553 stop:2509 length:957 start_codon:yes stop_codon:yes gene_type:complete